MHNEINFKYQEGRLSIHSDKSTGSNFWLYPPLCLTHKELQILYCILQGKVLTTSQNIEIEAQKQYGGKKNTFI